MDQEQTTEQINTAEETSFEEEMAAAADAESEGLEQAEDEQPEGKEEEAGEEQKDEGEGEGNEPESEPVPYTEDEFNSIDPFEIDPGRLTKDGAAVHRRYMQMYREQILPELERLRAFRQRAEEIAAANGAQRDPRQEFANEVKARAARALGVQELDELNPEHLIELSRQSVMLQNELAAREGAERGRQETMRRMEALKAALHEEIADFDVIDRFAKADLNNLPYARAQKVIADLQSGDAGRIRSVYKMFSERYAASKKKKTEPAAPAPAKVIRSSSGEAAPRNVDYDAFTGASADEQARMLVNMGLVEEEI